MRDLGGEAQRLSEPAWELRENKFTSLVDSKKKKTIRPQRLERFLLNFPKTTFFFSVLQSTCCFCLGPAVSKPAVY